MPPRWRTLTTWPSGRTSASFAGGEPNTRRSIAQALAAGAVAVELQRRESIAWGGRRRRVWRTVERVGAPPGLARADDPC